MNESHCSFVVVARARRAVTSRETRPMRVSSLSMTRASVVGEGVENRARARVGVVEGESRV